MKLFSYIYKHCDLLVPFLKHYDRLGITDYFLIVNTWGNETIEEEVREYSRGRKVTLSVVHQIFLSDEKVARLEGLKRKHASPNEWVIVTDLDEFLEFSPSLKATVLFHQWMGYDSVYGLFVDRIHQEGALTSIDPQVPLERQFPLGADLTKNILLGWVHKIVLMKAGVQLTNCAHAAVKNVWDGRFHALIHHYKWNAEVLERLKDRIETFRPRQMLWWRESERFMEFYKKMDRIDIADPRLNIRTIKPGRHGALRDMFELLRLMISDVINKLSVSILSLSINILRPWIILFVPREGLK